MLFYSLRTGCAGGDGGQALNETVFNLMKYYGSFVVAQRNIIKLFEELRSNEILSFRNNPKFVDNTCMYNDCIQIR